MPSGQPTDRARKALGRYQILGELAKGAMGTVYKAHDPARGSVVALKVMSTSLATSPDEEKEFLARFEREAQVAARLQHPWIVSVLDMGRVPDEGLFYIALEYVEGETLRDRLMREGRLPLADAVMLGSRMARALHHAHALGVVHRDVKPSNILLGPEGVVKLTDFGIARVPQSDLTRTGVHVGTPNFMAPEQVKGRTADPRSDQFALGILLYWMLTGKRPFGEDDPARVAYRTVNVLPVPPHEAAPAVPEPLSRIVLRALEKDPARRYGTTAELAEALDALGVAPPQASPVAPPPPAPAEATSTLAVPRSELPARAPRAIGLSFVAVAVLAAFALGAGLVALATRGRDARVAPAPVTRSARDAAFERAVSRYAAGDLAGAEGELEALLVTDPSHDAARSLLDRTRALRSGSPSPDTAEPPVAPGPTEAALPAAETPAPATPVTPLSETETPPPPPGVSAATPAATASPEASPTPGPPPSMPAALPVNPPLPTPAPARLALTLSHRLERGSLEVLVDGSVAGTMALIGTKKAFGRIRGESSGDVKVPSGRHTIALRIKGTRGDEPVSVEKTLGILDLKPGASLPLPLELDGDGVLTRTAP